MTADQFSIVLRAFVRRRPFRAFFIELVNGERIHVTHPESVVSVRGLYRYDSPSRTHHVFVPASVCQLLDVPTSPAGQ